MPNSYAGVDDTPRPSLAHRVEYALLSGAVAVGEALGARGAARLGGVLGGLGYWPLGIRRRVVESHLAQAFPERDVAWVRRTAREAYAHLGREMFAMLRLARTSREAIIASTEVIGFDALRAAVDAGRGAIVVTGHLGNWEIGGASLAARGIPMDVVAQRQANPLFDRMVVRARERLGMRVIERSRATKLALRSLREGRAVAFVADQDARRAGVFVPFFGRLASTHRGPALMAVRTGAPLFLGSCLRVGDGYRITLRQITVREGSGDVDDAVIALTAAFTRGLEEAIRAAPEQYFWHHRRWKTRPVEEPARRAPGIPE
ncbi:MAG TPA: lysophospholipid acyltransferase family protein [Longimicrobiales bacterium]|nr:lysophospholipid acyltransferase family protein [Longimicrobiales bacterium]